MSFVADQAYTGQRREHGALMSRRACECARNCCRPLLLFVAALLGGCIGYQAAPLKPQRSAEVFAARRLDAPALRDEVARLLPQSTSTWPPSTWDRAQLLVVALLQNPQLAVARAQLQLAHAHETTTAELPNPDLSLQSEYARHDPHPWLYGIGLNFLLPSSERRRLDSDLARLATSNADWQLLDQTWAVRHGLVTALSAWESARRREQSLQRLATTQQHLLALVQTRVTAGEDTPGELLIERQAQLETAQQLAQARAEIIAAQDASAAALGVLPTALDGLQLHWPEWGEPPPFAETKRRDTREQALLSRADLAATISDYDAAETKLKLAVARQYPQLELSPGYYWDHGVAKFPFDVGFSLPLFNRNRGEIGEATAARELAAQRMLAQQAEIYGQIASAERAEDNARSSVDAAQRSLHGAQEQQRQAELGLRLGAFGMQEKLGAEIVAIGAELETLQMQASWQNTRNALEDALHTPLSGPELLLPERLPVIVSGTQP